MATTAKRKPLPTNDDGDIDSELDQQAREESYDNPKMVLIEIPIMDRTIRKRAQRIDCRLNRAQTNTLLEILDGLEAQNQKLADGTIIRRPQHALKWLVESAMPQT